MKKEDIEHAAREHARQNFPPVESVNMYRTGKTAGYISGFIDGAQWAINSVFRDADKERPEPDRYYLAIVEIPGKPARIAIWKDDCWRQANHPFFKRWAYPEDFILERKEDAE